MHRIVVALVFTLDCIVLQLFTHISRSRRRMVIRFVNIFLGHGERTGTIRIFVSFCGCICRDGSSDLKTLFTRAGVKFMRCVSRGETFDSTLNLFGQTIFEFCTIFCIGFSALGECVGRRITPEKKSWFSCSPLVAIDLVVCLLVL